MLDVRPLELPEELASVGAERLDVAPLPLGVERVEGQRGFARAADAGEDHELPLGDLQPLDVEVVLLRADDLDEVGLARGGEERSRHLRLLRCGGEGCDPSSRPGEAGSER